MSFFREPAATARLPAAQIDKVYPRRRYRVFVSIFIGYMGYYFVRNTTSVLSGILHLSATDIGIISCASFLAYGVSKFVSGLLSDRSNARFFLSAGLFLSGLVNVLIGWLPGILTSVTLFTTMYLLNGWIQGMGYPPGAKTLVYWYDARERITWGTLWNLSHNVGGALAPLIIGFSFGWVGDSALEKAQAAFIVPGVLCMAMSVLVGVLQLDRPVSVGLPPVEEWRGSAPPPDPVVPPPMADILKTTLFGNRKLLCCCLYGAFVYILRYGIVAWAPRFLSDAAESGGKGMGKLASMGGFSVFEIGGIAGMLLAGYLSVRVFRNSKPLTNVAFLLFTILLLAIYWWMPAGQAWLYWNYAVLVLLGLSVYGPVMFIGLYAMELVPKAAAGAASGLSGTFSYILGSIMATLGMGVVVDHLGWGAAFVLLIGAALGAIGFSLLSRDRSLEFSEPPPKGGPTR
ncbi:MFS transporter [Pantoea sp. 1.19]|uniref:MFS transporter n=1 Tax=Pantoea sp. 1.19 TaxID=1925589 RepID=UPI000948CBE8|nr:MFS transporter [Pantoea sp. 1.19]